MVGRGRGDRTVAHGVQQVDGTLRNGASNTSLALRLHQEYFSVTDLGSEIRTAHIIAVLVRENALSTVCVGSAHIQEGTTNIVTTPAGIIPNDRRDRKQSTTTEVSGTQHGGQGTVYTRVIQRIIADREDAFCRRVIGEGSVRRGGQCPRTDRRNHAGRSQGSQNSGDQFVAFNDGTGEITHVHLHTHFQRDGSGLRGANRTSCTGCGSSHVGFCKIQIAEDATINRVTHCTWQVAHQIYRSRNVHGEIAVGNTYLCSISVTIRTSPMYHQLVMGHGTEEAALSFELQSGGGGNSSTGAGTPETIDAYVGFVDQ